MAIEVRPASTDDAHAISAVVIAALRRSNARDYSAAVIAQVERSFTPDTVAALIDRRAVFVAVQDEQVVATASLDGHVVRTVFVHPDRHGQGIGRLLMATLERLARDRQVQTLLVPSSLTAEPFYRKLGFVTVREVLDGEERTIVMERQLAVPSA